MSLKLVRGAVSLRQKDITAALRKINESEREVSWRQRMYANDPAKKLVKEPKIEEEAPDTVRDP